MVDLNLRLPDNFFNEEVRCGYTVTREMKEIWAVELDLLNKLLEVCRKHDLKIFADGGTLLGAVRDHGFIPWDNDIDLAMLRDDYDKLCEISASEFEPPYFFQCYHTEKRYPRRHAQLRNSSTTGILKNEVKWDYKFNQGIFIDIFVLDGLHEDDSKQASQRKKGEILQKIIYYKSRKNTPNKIYQAICKCIPWTAAVKIMDRIMKDKRANESQYVVNYGFSFKLGEKVTKRERHYYDSTIEMPFENIMIPVPEKYDAWLTLRYGDYMSPSTAGAVHGDVILDADISYSDYIERMKQSRT